MKKPLFVIIVLFILILVNGCNLNSTEITTKEEKQNSAKQEHLIVTDSIKDNGWKEFTAKVSLSEMIYDVNSRGSMILAGDRMVDYSIYFPESWTLTGTVITDSNKKVAEIAPAVLLKKGEEVEFLDYKTVEGEVITKESISVSKYKGTKVILQVDTERGIWYPHMYLISDGTFGFTMTIYSHNQIRDKVEEKLFDDIVNTFRFKQE